MEIRRIQIVISMITGITIFLLNGCAAPNIVGPVPDKGLLNFLEDGKTTKPMIFEKLGQPSGTFENETILTYRIGFEEGKGYFIFDAVPRPGLYKSKYSLVLIFNEKGILVRHNLVNVR